MRTFTYVSLTVVMASLLLPNAFAEMSKKQQAQYPEKDVLPDVNSPQVKKWVSEIDWSKVPNIPIAKAEIPNCPDCPAGKKGVPEDACWWTCDGCVAKDDIEVCPREKAWGLTYDDGPSEETPRLLKKLRQANVTSTFFVVGSRILEYPETLKQQVKEGHHIGLHSMVFLSTSSFFLLCCLFLLNQCLTPLFVIVYVPLFAMIAWSHAGMTSLTNEQIVAEIKWAEKAVFDVTGLKTKYWRPPYGDVDNRVREIVRQMGYKTVIWTKEWDSNDWQIPDKTITNKQVFRNFKWALSTVPKLKGGVITLEHDLYVQTVNVAGPLLDMGMKKGLEPMDIARCVNDPNPYQNSLVQKPAAKKTAPAPAAAVKPNAQKPLVVPNTQKPLEAPNAQKPLEAPNAQKPLEAPEAEAKDDEKIATKDSNGEDEAIEKSSTNKKPSQAMRTSWAVSSLVVVVLSAIVVL
ncbi:chitin deacetylase [Podila humilis]|nr:chitin deacetylase [Podila humilis]